MLTTSSSFCVLSVMCAVPLNLVNSPAASSYCCLLETPCPAALQLLPPPLVSRHHWGPERTWLHRTRTAETDGEESVHLWKFKGGTKNLSAGVCEKTREERAFLSLGQLSALWQGEQRAIRASHPGRWLNLSLGMPHSWLDGTSVVEMSNMRAHRCVGVSQQSPLLFKPNSNHFSIKTIAPHNGGEAQTGRCPAGRRRDRVGVRQRERE